MTNPKNRFERWTDAIGSVGDLLELLFEGLGACCELVAHVVGFLFELLSVLG